MKKNYAFLSIFCLVYFFSNQSYALSQKASHHLKIETFDKKIFDLEHKKGKIVIVNFWAKWCKECLEEMPILNELQKKYQAQGLEIIGLSIDRKKQKEEVKTIASKLSYQNALATEAIKSSFEEPDEIPMNYIFSRDGKLVLILSSSEKPLKIEDFEKALKPLL